MTCELVCTGWYASEAPRTYQTFGDDFVRGKAFRQLWWESIDAFVEPRAVFVLDSASPVKASDRAHTTTNVINVELLSNPGHAQNCAGHYSGWTASVLLGMEYALHSGADYFLYIEQDALIFGKQFIRRVEERLRRADFVFGASDQIGSIEQSVFAVSRNGLRRFISALHAIDHTDREVTPEWKFMSAASRFRSYPFLHLVSWKRPFLLRRIFHRPLARMLSSMKSYETFGFGYGRSRPIDFAEPVFYFQQGTREELDAYARLTGFDCSSNDARPSLEPIEAVARAGGVAR